MLTNTRLRSFKSRTSRGLAASARLLPAARLAQRAKQPAKPEPCAQNPRPSRPTRVPQDAANPSEVRESLARGFLRFTDGVVASAKPSDRFGLCSPPFPISQHKQTGLLVRMERKGAFPTRRFYVLGGGGAAAEKYTGNRQ